MNQKISNNNYMKILCSLDRKILIKIIKNKIVVEFNEMNMK